MTTPLVVTRSTQRIRPDPARVVAELFVPGQEVVAGSESRATAVVQRVLALDEPTVERRLADIVERFGHRHRDLDAVFRQHEARIENRMRRGTEITDARRLLLGATFTHEQAIEAASLCNPSLVPHPDQSRTPSGALRVVMSARAISEGHRSSIEFRTGMISATGSVIIDEPGPYAAVGTHQLGRFERDGFHHRLEALGTDGETAASVLDALGETFTTDELEVRLARLSGERDTRPNAAATMEQLRAISCCTYDATFSTDTELSDRVLSPMMATESHGMEDARFVRFVDDDGTATYFAPYTAFDGSSISQQFLRTTDFVTFHSSPITGPAAGNKGLALFPRRIDGHYASMLRHDRETNAVAFSTTPTHWEAPTTVQQPKRDWELIQLGNCGSPIETERGWLVLTHGVGPMRTYSIGAVLLDLDDPTQLLASLATPLLEAADHEQDGYVPNVVYSCGALLHGDTLVIPYGVADTSISIATVACNSVLDAMVPNTKKTGVLND